MSQHQHQESNEVQETSALELHQSVMREAADPHEAIDPGPRWFYVFTIVTLVVGGFYLGRHMGEFGTATHIGYLPPETVTAAISDSKSEAAPQISGATIYNGKCSSCHQADGKGVPGAFPPLAGSPYVTGDAAVTARILLHGMQGPLEIAGQNYNGIMPAWKALLSDDEIAAVISHIRGNLGNKAPAVDAEFVAKVRQETSDRTAPWTADELDKIGAGS